MPKTQTNDYQYDAKTPSAQTVKIFYSGVKILYSDRIRMSSYTSSASSLGSPNFTAS